MVYNVVLYRTECNPEVVSRRRSLGGPSLIFDWPPHYPKNMVGYLLSERRELQLKQLFEKYFWIYTLFLCMYPTLGTIWFWGLKELSIKSFIFYLFGTTVSGGGGGPKHPLGLNLALTPECRDHSTTQHSEGDFVWVSLPVWSASVRLCWL